MIFSEVLAAVDRELRSRSVPFAIAGGVALAVHGIQRTTLDLDLVTDGGCRFRVHEAMAALGYVPSRDLPDILRLRELPGVDPERADGYLARWGLKRELRSDDE
jgi:hypothetical protein